MRKTGLSQRGAGQARREHISDPLWQKHSRQPSSHISPSSCLTPREDMHDSPRVVTALMLGVNKDGVTNEGASTKDQKLGTADFCFLIFRMTIFNK